MLYRYAATTTPNISQGWRAWRLRVDEPGVWLIHCHVRISLTPELFPSTSPLLPSFPFPTITPPLAHPFTQLNLTSLLTTPNRSSNT